MERAAGHRIIAPQRSNSAHIHRPWCAKLGPFDTKPRTSRFRTTAVGRKAATKDRSLAPSGAMRSRRRPVPNNLLGVAFKSGLPRATPALARDSGRNVRPVFLEPSHCLRSIDDTLEGFPGWILEGVGSQSIHHILNEVMQAFVSSSAFEGVRNRVLAQPCWAKSIMLGTSGRNRLCTGTPCHMRRIGRGGPRCIRRANSRRRSRRTTRAASKFRHLWGAEFPCHRRETTSG